MQLNVSKMWRRLRIWGKARTNGAVRIITGLGKYLGLGSHVAGTQSSCVIETVRNNV